MMWKQLNRVFKLKRLPKFFQIFVLKLRLKKIKKEYQVFDSDLQQRLIEVLTSNNSELLIAIPPFSSIHDDSPDVFGTLSFWEKYHALTWNKIKRYLSGSQCYYNAFVSRKTVYEENELSKIKKIFGRKKILFVVGKNSRFEFEHSLFADITCKKFVYGPNISAYSSYDDILTQIKEYDTSFLIFLALGPTATILAYELCQLGYQALDLGHLTNTYLESIGVCDSPEKEARKTIY